MIAGSIPWIVKYLTVSAKVIVELKRGPRSSTQGLTAVFPRQYSTQTQVSRTNPMRILLLVADEWFCTGEKPEC